MLILMKIVIIWESSGRLSHTMRTFGKNEWKDFCQMIREFEEKSSQGKEHVLALFSVFGVKSSWRCASSLSGSSDDHLSLDFPLFYFHNINVWHDQKDQERGENTTNKVEKNTSGKRCLSGFLSNLLLMLIQLIWNPLREWEDHKILFILQKVTKIQPNVVCLEFSFFSNEHLPFDSQLSYFRTFLHLSLSPSTRDWLASSLFLNRLRIGSLLLFLSSLGIFVSLPMN